MPFGCGSMPLSFISASRYSRAFRLMNCRQCAILLRGCMTIRANAGSLRQSVCTYSETHSLRFRRVRRSVSFFIRSIDALTSSVSLICSIFASTAVSAARFSACCRSHSAFRLASASSCRRRFSASAAAGSSCSASVLATDSAAGSLLVTSAAAAAFFCSCCWISFACKVCISAVLESCPSNSVCWFSRSSSENTPMIKLLSDRKWAQRFCCAHSCVIPDRSVC